MTPSMTLADYSDRELLAILAEHGDEDGWARTSDIADTIGIDHPNPNNCVGTRLGWLRRFGAVERDPRGRWRLTDIGQAMLQGTLRSSQERVIEQIDDTQMLSLMRMVSIRYRHMADTPATLVRREWRHGELVLKAGENAGYETQEYAVAEKAAH